MEPFSIKNTNSLETILFKTSTDIVLQNSKELSSMKTADIYSTISMVDSTGNAPKITSTQPVCYIFANDVCTNLEQICRVKGWQLETGCVVEDNF